jgi:ribosomal protein S18 acetylase RimI-like enzyme
MPAAAGHRARGRPAAASARTARRTAFDRSQAAAANALLANVAWHALAGHQARHAIGADAVRRYAPGFAPIVAFADPAHPDLDALAHLCAPGERLYCHGRAGAATAGWRIEAESSLLRMLWDGPMRPADETSGVVHLRAEHTEQALVLAGLAQPGPFGPRGFELGEYVGTFDGATLVAMAGERMHAGSLREISGVCPRSEIRGRGQARGLMLTLIRRQLRRGELPMLHVSERNTAARSLYR